MFILNDCQQPKQDHLSMNNSTGSNNHLRSIDLFKSKIILNNLSKVRDDQPHPLPHPTPPLAKADTAGIYITKAKNRPLAAL